MITPELRHRHSGQAGDGEKIRYSDLEGKPTTGPATDLQSATTIVNVSGSPAPSVGKVLTATDSTHATWQTPAASGGTVTKVSVTTANGVSGTVVTDTTTPAISLTLGAITPSSVAATGTVTGTNLSGNNSGDNASNSTSNSYADGKVENAIVAGHTSIAPSGYSVNTALGLKAPIENPTFTGVTTIPALTIPTGASAGKVWTSDAYGAGYWAAGVAAIFLLLSLPTTNKTFPSSIITSSVLSNNPSFTIIATPTTNKTFPSSSISSTTLSNTITASLLTAYTKVDKQ